MITERENRRLSKIRRAIASRVRVDKKDAQWALDLARREGAVLRPETIQEATRQGYDASGIKTKE